MLSLVHYYFLSELYMLMKDQDDGVRELKLEQDSRIFNHCFTGTAILLSCGGSVFFYF